MRPLLGIAAILALAWVISEDRYRVPWRLVATGVVLQFALALLFLKFPPAAAAFLLLNACGRGDPEGDRGRHRVRLRLSRRR